MFKQICFILHYLRGLMAHPMEIWTELLDPKEPVSQSEYSIRHYYGPILGTGALLIFLLHGNGVMLRSKLPYDAPFNLEYAMKGMVSFALSYTAGPALAFVIIKSVCGALAAMRFDKNQLEIFILYNMSFLMACDMFCACFPSFTFLSFIGLYMLYIMLEGVDHYMKLGSGRGLFAMVAFLSIYFSPILFNHILASFEK